MTSSAKSEGQPQSPKSLPLLGVRVLDLTRVYSGPYCTFLMAMAGAEVIKVEALEGESVRNRTARFGGAALPFAMLNANKRLISINLKEPDGVKVLERLVVDVDVLVENFRPGVMDRLGLTKARLREINPRLIIAQTSGYGNNGPYRDYPAMDLTVQAVAGIINTTGYPDSAPVKAGPALVDFAAGTHLYGAIVSALFSRERSGQALDVEVSMMEAIYPTLASNLAMAVATSEEEFIPRTGNRHGGLSVTPYNVYPASDGLVAIICNNERHWVALAKALRREDWLSDPKYNPLKQRVDRMDELDTEIGHETQKYTRQALFELLNSAGAACAPVRTLHEVIRDPHLRERGMVHEIDHPEFGHLVVMNSPIHYGDVARPSYVPSGKTGADTDAILRDQLGMSEDDVRRLRQVGAVA